VVLPIRARRRQGSLGGLLGSLLAGLLLLGGLPLQPVRAAELLEIQLDGLQLPLDLEELQAWSKDPSRPRGDLGAWFDLLAPHHREGLLRLLRAPLVRDRSMAQQLLQSWVGQRMLASMGGLFSTEKGNAGPLMYSTLSDLLLRQEEVTTLELLRALPSRRLTVNLDGVLELAARWQSQLELQRQSLQALRRLQLPEGTPLLPLTDGVVLASGNVGGLAPESNPPRRLQLTVPYRREPLQLQLWQPTLPRPGAPWLLLSPGLGGSSSQLEWLACWSTPAAMSWRCAPGWRGAVRRQPRNPSAIGCGICRRWWKRWPRAPCLGSAPPLCWWVIRSAASPACWRLGCGRSPAWRGVATAPSTVCRSPISPSCCSASCPMCPCRRLSRWPSPWLPW
jgi:hypothetical protein